MTVPNNERVYDFRDARIFQAYLTRFMPRFNDADLDFDGGEFSGPAQGRAEASAYDKALATVAARLRVPADALDAHYQDYIHWPEIMVAEGLLDPAFVYEGGESSSGRQFARSNWMGGI